MEDRIYHAKIEDKAYCDKCGKCMTQEVCDTIMPTTMIGITISMVDIGNEPRYKEFIKKQMGKYEVGREYRFCFECVLDTLFGK